MKKKTFLLMVFTTLILVACNNEDQNTINSDQITDIKELVHEYSVGENLDQSASITSKHLIVTDQDGSETMYELPEDEFFVSIAPFIHETHPCTNHSLTGCQGELVEKDFDIYIEDTKGNVIIDDTMTSMANGFIDLWVPRDRTYRITIEHKGKRVESEFSTFENDGTCLTTMQLM